MIYLCARFKRATGDETPPAGPYPPLLYCVGAQRLRPALRPRGPRPHARAGRAVLHSPPRGPRRPRDQDRAARLGRRDASRRAPARAGPRGSEHLLRALQRRQGERRARSRAPRRAGRGPRPGAGRGRGGRELRPRRDGAARLRLRDAGCRQARSDLLLDLGLRADRPVAAPPGLRPSDPRRLGHDASRAGRRPGSPLREPAGGRRPRRHPRLRQPSSPRSGAAREQGKAPGSMSRCSRRSSPPTT